MPNWWVNSVLEYGGPALLFASIIWVIVSITLHELAHGWAAVSRGDPTPIDSGHMTWNPLVHMGLPSLLMFALTGMAWGLMPVDPSRMRGRHADAWVSFAGPLMNFVLAIVCILASAVVVYINPTSLAGMFDRASDHTHAKVLLFFAYGCWLNIALGLFNLLPAPPLDGSRIVASFSRQYRDMLHTTGGQFGGMIVLIIGFVFAPRLIGGIGPWVWSESLNLIFRGLNAAGLAPSP
ncbi:MAG: site-2 protease family protein [Phycisphaerales bacterium]|nr:site-2 protease family protein [Phycisphaerales bacterium]